MYTYVQIFSHYIGCFFVDFFSFFFAIQKFCCCCSVAKLCLILWDPRDTSFLCPPLSLKVHSISYPLSNAN